MKAVGGQDRERAGYGLSVEQSKTKFTEFMLMVFLKSHHRHSSLYDKKVGLGVGDSRASELNG